MQSDGLARRIPADYTTAARAFHWLFVLIFLVMFPLGYIMADMKPSPDKLTYVSWHKSIGITALALGVLRILWRLTHRPPPLPAGVPLWQRAISHIVHWLLYAVIFLLPLSGWAMSSAAGFTVKPFGLFPLPNFVPKDKALFEILHERHEQIGYVLLALIAIHLGAALFHFFVQKDNVLARMIPFMRRS